MIPLPSGQPISVPIALEQRVARPQCVLRRTGIGYRLRAPD
jgi:hypothetical protein